jgi:hypothetical protein
MHFVYLAEHSEWTGARHALSSASAVSVAETWSDLRLALGA